MGDSHSHRLIARPANEDHAAKILEVEAKLIHCGPADGTDFTLCGFTLDGDQGEIPEWEGGRIDCPQCLTIIRFCRSINGRSLSSTQEKSP